MLVPVINGKIYIAYYAGLVFGKYAASAASLRYETRKDPDAGFRCIEFQ